MQILVEPTRNSLAPHLAADKPAWIAHRLDHSNSAFADTPEGAVREMLLATPYGASPSRRVTQRFARAKPMPGNREWGPLHEVRWLQRVDPAVAAMFGDRS